MPVVGDVVIPCVVPAAMLCVYLENGLAPALNRCIRHSRRVIITSAYFRHIHTHTHTRITPIRRPSTPPSPPPSQSPSPFLLLPHLLVVVFFCACGTKAYHVLFCESGGGIPGIRAPFHKPPHLPDRARRRHSSSSPQQQQHYSNVWAFWYKLRAYILCVYTSQMLTRASAQALMYSYRKDDVYIMMCVCVLRARFLPSIVSTAQAAKA